MTNIYIPKIEDLPTTLILSALAGGLITKFAPSFTIAKIFLVQTVADNILFQMANLTFNSSQNRRTSEWIFTSMNAATTLTTTVALHQLCALRPISIAGLTFFNVIVFVSRIHSIYQEERNERLLPVNN